MATERGYRPASEATFDIRARRAKRHNRNRKYAFPVCLRCGHGDRGPVGHDGLCDRCRKEHRYHLDAREAVAATGLPLREDATSSAPTTIRAEEVAAEQAVRDPRTASAG